MKRDTFERHIAALALGAATFPPLLLAACSSQDLSCYETATCSPEGSDAAPDARSDGKPDGVVQSSDAAVRNDSAVDAPADRAADTSLVPSDAVADSPRGDAPTDAFLQDGVRSDVPIADRTLDSLAVDHRNDRDVGAVDGEPKNDVSTDIHEAGIRVDAGADRPDGSVDAGPADIAPSPDVHADTVDACATNACGGCGPLGSAPGSACGQCGKYVCNPGGDSVSCDDPGYVKYKSVAVSEFRTCGITTTGGVRCWGWDLETDVKIIAPPTSDFMGDVANISMGHNATCVITNGGNLRCWGHNTLGQLGDGTDIPKWGIPNWDTLSSAKGVALGTDHGCGITSANAVRCWGDSSSAQVGAGGSGPFLSPSPEVLFDVRAVLAHETYSCALTLSGGVRCWGTMIDVAVPYPPSADLLSGVDSIGGGAFHACAVMTNGELHCWGSNSAAQLGDLTMTNAAVPVRANITNVRAVVGGHDHTCALLANGDVRCWGGNFDGQLGDGTNVPKQDPSSGTSILTDVTMLAASRTAHTCALLSTGGIRCWGYNNFGQIGAGDREVHLVPTDVRDVCP